MTAYAHEKVEALAGCDLSGYILKRGSPSCGMDGWHYGRRVCRPDSARACSPSPSSSGARTSRWRRKVVGRPRSADALPGAGLRLPPTHGPVRRPGLGVAPRGFHTAHKLASWPTPRQGPRTSAGWWRGPPPARRASSKPSTGGRSWGPSVSPSRPAATSTPSSTWSATSRTTSTPPPATTSSASSTTTGRVWSTWWCRSPSSATTSAGSGSTIWPARPTWNGAPKELGAASLFYSPLPGGRGVSPQQGSVGRRGRFPNSSRTGVGQGRPGLRGPGAEVAVGHAGAGQPGVGVDPQERARPAEMAEGGGGVAAARPVRATSRPAARSRAPSRWATGGRSRGHAVEPGEGHGGGPVQHRRAEHPGRQELPAEGQEVGGAARRHPRRGCPTARVLVIPRGARTASVA